MGGVQLRFVRWRGSAMPFALLYMCGPSSTAPLLTLLRYTDTGDRHLMRFTFANAKVGMGWIPIHGKDQD